VPLFDQRYTVRLPLPDELVKGRANIVRAPVYLSGQLQAPSSATVSILDAGGTVIVDAASASITGSVATYTTVSTVFDSSVYGEGWVVEWTITLSDGTVLLPRNTASLCRAGLWPVVADPDLYRRERALNPALSGCITSATTYQDQIDEAWTELMLRVILRGNRPALVLEPSALRAAHLTLALARVFGSEGTRLPAAFADRESKYIGEHEAAWNAIAWQYSTADDRIPDERRRPANPTVWLSGGAGRSSW
jgi:hypothetical protein